MTDHYAVIGNPIAHSRSPAIHAAFAAQTGQDIRYQALFSPLDAFEAVVRGFAVGGGRGMNVTLPFKEQAFALAGQRSPRAQAAGAANTLIFDAQGITADNTDGVGLVRDLTGRHRLALAGMPVILLGAGGAAGGVILPLLAAGASRVLVVNRTAGRALQLVERFRPGPVEGLGFPDLDPALAEGALLVNATSAGLAGHDLPVPGAVFARAAFVYDMVYGAQATPFLRQAAAAGARACADGLGMLVEQAAESFRLWRGVQPDTDPVFRGLREAIGAQ